MCVVRVGVVRGVVNGGVRELKQTYWTLFYMFLSKFDCFPESLIETATTHINQILQ